MDKSGKTQILGDSGKVGIFQRKKSQAFITSEAKAHMSRSKPDWVLDLAQHTTISASQPEKTCLQYSPSITLRPVQPVMFNHINQSNSTVDTWLQFWSWESASTEAGV